MEYDPILSKLIVHAQDRQDCIRRMIRALKDYVILGVLTPIPSLVDILSSEAFCKGETYTDFIEAHFAQWQPLIEGIDLVTLAYVVDAVANRRRPTADAQSDAEAFSPWLTLGNFRP